MSSGRSPARHYCDHPDCGKSFRRAEHLNRHKLNHTDFTIQCPQCDRLFYRRDLLQRHVALKHGQAPKASRRANADGVGDVDAEADSVPALTVSAQGAHSRNRNQSLGMPGSDHNFTQNAAPGPPPAPGHFTPAALAADSPVNAATINRVVLPMAGDPYPFSSPSLNLAEDWGWLQQSPVPVPPANAGMVQQVDHANQIPNYALTNAWMDVGGYQDLFVGQDVHDFLVALSPIVENSHRFTIQDTSSILNTSFLFILESLPIFHQPTFNFQQIRKELCVTIFALGLLIANDPSMHHLGCLLLQHTRFELLQYIDKNTIYREDLGILQALLLIEFSGMYYADRATMELTDVFHGTLVTLCRRLGLFETTQTNARTSSVPADENQWKDNVEKESAKRLAYFVFALDIEQALFFGHERNILPIYSIKLELPSDEGGWQLPHQRAHMNQIETPCPTKFHVLCQNLLSKGSEYAAIPVNLNQTSNFIILLGLSSVVLDVLRRQKDPFFDTKQAQSRLGSVLPILHHRLLSGPEGSMKLHGRTIYHITVIALYTPLNDLEEAANDGFSRTGRTSKQNARAAIIRLLTRHKVGAEPARHAVHLLKLYLTPPNAETPTGHMGNRYANSPSASLLASYSPFEPSALYFGVLTLWAYVIGRVSELDEDDTQMPQESFLPVGDVHPSQSTTPSSSADIPITVLLQSIEAAIDNDDTLACRSHWRSVVPHVSAKLGLRRNNNAQEYSLVARSLLDNLNI